MTKIISVINQKGGVGKSTTAAALTAGLARAARQVLVIDLDAQGNLSHTMMAAPNKPTAADVLTGRCTLNEAIQTTDSGADIIPSDEKLTLPDNIITGRGREYVLRKVLEGIRGSYDYIIIDTAPALNIISIAALTASTGAIIAAQADIYSIAGIAQLYETIKVVRAMSNNALEVLGILITRYNGRTNISRDAVQVIENAAKRIGTKVFRSKIRECTAIREAQMLRRDIFTYAPRCNAAKDYLALIEEIQEG